MTSKAHNNSYAKSDTALGQDIGQYIRHHRLQQNRTQESVASEAGISRSTLNALEGGSPVTLETLIRVLRTLQLLEVLQVFSIDHRPSPLLLAQAERNQRRRARASHSRHAAQGGSDATSTGW
jgi:transcriptional regulator with XRE-family HTH domain